MKPSTYFFMDGLILVLSLSFVFPLFIIAGVFYLISRIGGWAALARRYRATEAPTPDGKVFRWQSGSIGYCNYNNCLWINVSKQGLYLSPGPFRVLFLFHPPLLIPWSSLDVVRQRQFLAWKSVDLHVDVPPIARLQLPQRILDAAESLLASDPENTEGTIL
jgi:hypothetical protein